MRGAIPLTLSVYPPMPRWASMAMVATLTYRNVIAAARAGSFGAAAMHRRP
jgi:hypothetical protein